MPSSIVVLQPVKLALSLMGAAMAVAGANTAQPMEEWLRMVFALAGWASVVAAASLEPTSSLDVVRWDWKQFALALGAAVLVLAFLVLREAGGCPWYAFSAYAMAWLCAGGLLSLGRTSTEELGFRWKSFAFMAVGALLVALSALPAKSFAPWTATLGTTGWVLFAVGVGII